VPKINQVGKCLLKLLDYGSATLAGIPACLLNRLQSVLNDAARSIAGLRRSSVGAYYIIMLSPVFTGFEHPSASRLNWRSSFIYLFMALHLRLIVWQEN